METDSDPNKVDAPSTDSGRVVPPIPNWRTVRGMLIVLIPLWIYGFLYLYWPTNGDVPDLLLFLLRSRGWCIIFLIEAVVFVLPLLAVYGMRLCYLAVKDAKRPFLVGLGVVVPFVLDFIFATVAWGVSYCNTYCFAPRLFGNFSEIISIIDRFCPF